MNETKTMDNFFRRTEEKRKLIIVYGKKYFKFALRLENLITQKDPAIKITILSHAEAMQQKLTNQEKKIYVGDDLSDIYHIGKEPDVFCDYGTHIRMIANSVLIYREKIDKETYQKLADESDMTFDQCVSFYKAMFEIMIADIKSTKNVFKKTGKVGGLAFFVVAAPSTLFTMWFEDKASKIYTWGTKQKLMQYEYVLNIFVKDYLHKFIK
ncbi:MAG: hypothetical protein HXO28_04570 [Prevotella sp.]|jgi:hypothetical protein|uniref:hypothetical protein n=1 Tax=Prevotella sp. TaxID=59823 RepID=UPI001CB0F89C|nr:hypothetical protein [Prevotella sp.]MBF1582715.1 hypothetical protein [Prevotella sp.]